MKFVPQDVGFTKDEIIQMIALEVRVAQIYDYNDIRYECIRFPNSDKLTDELAQQFVNEYYSNSYATTTTIRKYAKLIAQDDEPRT